MKPMTKAIAEGAIAGALLGAALRWVANNILLVLAGLAGATVVGLPAYFYYNEAPSSASMRAAIDELTTANYVANGSTINATLTNMSRYDADDLVLNCIGFGDIHHRSGNAVALPAQTSATYAFGFSFNVSDTCRMEYTPHDRLKLRQDDGIH